MRDMKKAMEISMEKVETNINEKLETRMTKIDDDIVGLGENIAKTDKKLGIRIDKIEEEMRRMRYKRIQSDTLGGRDRIQPDRSEERTSLETKETRTGKPMVRSKSWSDEVEENISNKENEKEEKEIYRNIEREKRRKEKEEKQKEEDRRHWTRDKRNPPHWSDNLIATVNPQNVERKEKVEEKQKKAVIKWFGCDTDNDTSDEEENPEEVDEEEWNTIDRKKARKEKLKRQNEKKRKRKEEVLSKAQNMVGLGPISGECLEKHMKKAQNDFEKAKLEAVREHLFKYYKYNDREYEQLDIRETKYVEKGDGIIYIAVDDKRNIREIYKRKAECKREEVMLKSFVPPQIFKRFVALNKICGERRASDRRLKTQVRFGAKDIEIWTKEKGTEEPFSLTPLRAFLGTDSIPDYDDEIKWRKVRDREPRRRVSSSRAPSPDASPAKGKNSSDNTTQNEEYLHEIGRNLRQLSVNSNDDLPPKRRRGDSQSMDSCQSKDLNGALESDPLDPDNEMEEDLNRTQ